MKKITGIKSVDFKIIASGAGVVNWNGNTKVRVNGDYRENHSLPKLRGFKNTSEKLDKNGNPMPIEVTDLDLKKTPVYISQNCLRHHIFKLESFNVTSDLKSEDAEKLLCSAIGLLRGYAIADSQPLMKKSPLLVEDLIEVTGNGNFEQLGKSGSRDQQTTMFSRTTMGETKYIGYGSISIEELQFISLDNRFGRSAIKSPISKEEGVLLAEKITEYLKTLDFDEKLNPKAVYDECYVRNGSVMDLGEAGILINDDGIRLLVEMMIDKLKNTYIQQAKGWMSVDNVIVDFNSSNRPMRIKKDEDSISSEIQSLFAVYYREGDENNIKKSKEMEEIQNKNKQSKKK